MLMFAECSALFRQVGLRLTWTWILDFDMHVAAHEKYKNSVVWQRDSYLFGVNATSATYDLVQVVDGEGNRLEPAWSDFVAYQKTAECGATPGSIWFRDYTPKAEGPAAGSGE